MKEALNKLKLFKYQRKEVAMLNRVYIDNVYRGKGSQREIKSSPSSWNLLNIEKQTDENQTLENGPKL